MASAAQMVFGALAMFGPVTAYTLYKNNYKDLGTRMFPPIPRPPQLNYGGPSMQNCCQHRLVYRPAHDTCKDAELRPDDVVLPPLADFEKYKDAFRAKQSVGVPLEPVLVDITNCTTLVHAPVESPGDYTYEPMADGPKFDDGTVLAVSMQTAQAMRLGQPSIDPENLALWFGGRNMRVVAPYTGPGPNCIRSLDGVIFGTRLFYGY